MLVGFQAMYRQCQALVIVVTFFHVLSLSDNLVV